MRRREIDDVVKKAFPAASAKQVEAAAERVLGRLALQSISNAPEPVLVLPKVYKPRWYWAVVGAAILVVILIPLYRKKDDQRAQQQVRIREDVLLMQAIEDDRSRIIPSSMERIMTLLPQDESTVS